MTFNSLQYVLFLPVVVVGYWLLPRSRPLLRQLWLLAASYLFYGAFDWRFLLLLWFTTAVDFLVGRALGRTEGARARRSLLLVSITANLGVLGYFKYAGFFVAQATALLDAIGLAPATPVLEIALPFGISFYTFQSMAYSIDVYRRRIEPCRNAVDFATFVAFFPQLVAGPISRAEQLLPQLERTRRPPDAPRITSGLLLVLTGLVKKVVIADPLASLVDEAFGRPGAAGPVLVVAGVVAFAVQIYADFSGYTDIARGSARLLGVELPWNFTGPYLSRSITEFWRRWHITLSTWLRDYLYIPLGGNRGSARRTSVNLLLTMLLGGLWHGAAWTFVVWGGLHGLYLVIDRARRVRVPDGDELPTLGQLPAVVVTFALTCVAWVFFRSRSLADAVDLLAGLARFGGAAPTWGQGALVVVTAAAMLALDLAHRRRAGGVTALVVRHPARVGVLVGVALVALLVWSGATPQPFLYFQF